MKKLLIVSLLVVVLMLLAVSAASANGGPHGDYTATTDACAGCHRAHTATADNLLMASSTHDLCMSCHGSGVQGANTNVDDGLYVNGRAPAKTDATPNGNSLLGGGFVNYGGAPVSSIHDPTGADDQAWGAGNERGVLAGIDAPLDCASCHDPHGSPNYRIIKEEINGVAVTVAQSDEGAGKDYSAVSWSAQQSDVCGACHNPYQNATHDTTTGTFTHTVDNVYGSSTTFTDSGGVTVSVDLASSYIVCQTCHFPHGTAATMTGFATGPGAGPTEGSALLREDNRGVCQACHQK